MLAKLKAFVEQGQTALVVKLMEKLHPKVLSVIDGRVDVYRDATLEALPRKCEDGLKAQAGSSSVAWLVDKVLGDDTDVLVAQLLAHLKPGVVSATDGLSASAADTIMQKLKQWLEGNDEQLAAAAAAGGGAPADDAAASMEALQVSSDEAPAAAEEHHVSLRKTAMSAASAVLFGLDSELSAFEEQARALVHPLFEKLKREVWELVPQAVQETLAGLVGQRDVDEAAVEGDDGGGTLGAWMSKVSNKLQGKASHLVDKVAAVTLDAVDGPMQELIARLVDELESSSTAAAFKEIRGKLLEYKLISLEAAEAAAAVSSPVAA